MADNPYFNPYRVAGEEISSTMGGRHVAILESDLVHPSHSDGFVNKGDPVSFGIGWAGCGVGIAMVSASHADEVITIDTEGIWGCEVVVSEDTLILGQMLFITSAGVIVDWPPDEFCHIFGYALESLEVGTGIISVKVHWMDTGIWWMMFWWWAQENPKL